MRRETRQLLAAHARSFFSSRFTEHGRELKRLSLLAPHTPGETALDGVPVRFHDAASYLAARQAIELDGIYDLPASVSAATIVDAGANLGIGVLRAMQHGAARVVAIEADPAIFAVLEANVAVWRTRYTRTTVELIHAAIMPEAGTVSFAPNGAVGGHVVDQTSDQTISVPAIPLGPILARLAADSPIDFVKIDIEGAEGGVLEEIVPQLPHVRRLFVEDHSIVGRPQTLPRILTLLQDAGFRLVVQCDYAPSAPLTAWTPSLGQDNRSNVFAVRDDLLA